MDRRSALAMIGGSLAWAPGSARAADEPIRVGMIPIEASMQPEYATERGFVAQVRARARSSEFAERTGDDRGHRRRLARSRRRQLDLDTASPRARSAARRRFARGAVRCEGPDDVHYGAVRLDRAIGERLERKDDRRRRARKSHVSRRAVLARQEGCRFAERAVHRGAVQRHGPSAYQPSHRCGGLHRTAGDARARPKRACSRRPTTSWHRVFRPAPGSPLRRG